MRTIIVIGGGFAGTAAARRLERRAPPDCEIVLISAENFMIYTPLLAEVVGASLLPGHSVAPLRRMLGRTRFCRARVEAIDTGRRIVHYRGREPRSLSYDHLVLACGKVADIGIADGMQAHGLALKTLGDALYLRNRIILRLEQAELEDDPDVRRTLTTFIVVGGGSSGVEVAGAIADFLRAARRFYPRNEPLDSKVIVLEGSDRLVPEFPPSLGETALRSMHRHGVEVHLDTRAGAVTALGVKADTGEWFRGANVVCTVGTRQCPLLASLELPRRKDLVRTDPDMSVPGVEGLWAIGDCAAVINAHDGEPSPPMAQFAVRQGRQVADNIARVLQGSDTRPFRYRSRGHVATIGHRRAIAHVFGIRLSGFTAWLLWRAVYLSMLPTFLRKLQVFTEWNLDLLFPRDTTQLHLERTTPPPAEQADDRQAPGARKAASG